MKPNLDIEIYQELQEKKIRKRRRIRIIILCCLALVPVLTYLETKVFTLGEVPFPVSGNVLVFVLININVLLLLLMVFLVLRELAQLLFDRRKQLLGTRLRTKIVISFVCLSLIPTALLFFVALQFVSTSMDYWFNINVEESLVESLSLARNIYQDEEERVKQLGKETTMYLETREKESIQGSWLGFYFADMLKKYNLAGLELISDQHTVIVSAAGPAIVNMEVPALPAELLRRTLAGEEGMQIIQAVAAGELVRGLTRVRMATDDFGENKVLVISMFIPAERLASMNVISKGLEGYRQLVLMKTPIKTSLLVMLLIVTLLIIFSAIWFGFYVAASLTGPMGKLADATRRVADGDLDFVIEKETGDEMGTLVDSFNQMTQDLLEGKRQIEETNKALENSIQELEERRRYTEIILRNVTAGVISLDKDGRITTINRFAEELLGVDRHSVLNRRYRSVLRFAHLSLLDTFLTELEQSGKTSIQRPLRLTIGDETFSLRVNFVRLEDDEGNRLGVVLVFDNLTELEKAQRMAAWREVARRIAHEVKNPLTPIQLSAQRLRKRYLETLAEEGEIFDLCTSTIINQVDELKRLVSEFSSFARMPAVRKSLNSITGVAREVLALYQEAHKNISFYYSCNDDVPPFSFDPEQMRRVLVNLLDNAVAVLPDGGIVEVALTHEVGKKRIFLEVNDNGPGVKDEDKLRLFEPYFSTKKAGTGLGLAIASTVVADHGGYIRVKDNDPSGARFIIELPFE